MKTKKMVAIAALTLLMSNNSAFAQFGNTTQGLQAGSSITTGDYNSFFGYQSGLNTTTGNSNSFMGMSCGNRNTSGFHNSFYGASAGFFNSSGVFNVFIGTASGNDNRSGTRNTFVGVFSGNNNRTGDNNVCLGYLANVDDGLFNSSAIGSGAYIDSSNKILLGNPAVTTIGGYTNYSTLSDQRYKKSIEKANNGLDFILALEPKTYQYDMVKLMKKQYAQMDASQNQTNTEGLTEEEQKTQAQFRKDELTFRKRLLTEAAKRSSVTETGLLAQQVEAAMEKTGYTHFNGLIKPGSDKGNYALAYSSFVVPLIGAVQEQQQQLTKKEQQIEDLIHRIEMLEAKEKEQRLKSSSLLNVIETERDPFSISLFPNPSRGYVSVKFSLDDEGQTEINVLDQVGKRVKNISSTYKEKGSHLININLANHTAGVYFLEITQGKQKAIQQLIIED